MADKWFVVKIVLVLRDRSAFSLCAGMLLSRARFLREFFTGVNRREWI